MNLIPRPTLLVVLPCFLPSFAEALSPPTKTILRRKCSADVVSRARQRACIPRRTNTDHFPSLSLFSTSSSASLVDLDTTSSPSTFDWFQQWYPVLPLNYFDDETVSKPRPITVLGKNLVVWRSTSDSSADDKNGADEFSVFEDTCPHRRAPLSTGKIVDEGGGCKNLVCRYHGWQFNSTGFCTKIPMMTTSTPSSADSGDSMGTDKDAFRVPSYPTKARGGLLWVYMDPYNTNPPPIPTDALLSEEEARNVQWIYTVFPVSYLSMTENSFDPAHAPFVHEGFGGRGGIPKYSPSDALPMERYSLVEKLDATKGFALEHTPYQQSVPSTSISTRKFIPPCTVLVTSHFTARLHFVPVRERETLSIASFFLNVSQNKGIMKLLPTKFKQFMGDTIHSIFFLADQTGRFFLQDKVIMQEQDNRKMMTNGESEKRGGRASIKDDWLDLTPTKSDAGVAAFQRWIQKYGGGGPFDMKRSNAAALEEPKPTSIWERHSKHCPQCQRVMKRAISLERRSGLASSLSFLFGLVSALVTSASVIFGGKGQAILSSASSSEATRSILINGSVSLAFLTMAVGLRWLAMWAKKIQDRFMKTEENAKDKLMDVYQY